MHSPTMRNLLFVPHSIWWSVCFVAWQIAFCKNSMTTKCDSPNNQTKVLFVLITFCSVKQSHCHKPLVANGVSMMCCKQQEDDSLPQSQPKMIFKEQSDKIPSDSQMCFVHSQHIKTKL